MSDTLHLLASLVGMDTTSRRSNLELVAFVEDLLDGFGVDHHRVPDATGTKANLVARIGPDAPGGVVLSAHTDCVPVEGQPWSRDPFTLARVDDRLHGRGTTDMKGFIAATLAAVPAAVAADVQRPLWLALSYDEEIGTVGAADLAADLEGAAPSAVIVGEPTRLRPVTAHKGVRGFTTEVHGRDGHSSKPQLAANAIAGAARIAAFIDGLAARHRDAAVDPRFDPPYTTFNLATIHGGQAINIVPRLATLTWEYRPVPADDSQDIGDLVERFARTQVLPDLQATYPEAAITFVADTTVPALQAEEGGAAEALVRRLTGDDAPAGTVPFGTDGGHFQRRGCSTVVCGPGDIEQAHQPDEYLEVGQLDACGAFLASVIEDLRRTG